MLCLSPLNTTFPFPLLIDNNNNYVTWDLSLLTVMSHDTISLFTVTSPPFLDSCHMTPYSHTHVTWHFTFVLLTIIIFINNTKEVFQWWAVTSHTRTHSYTLWTQVILVTARSHTTLMSTQVGLLITWPLYTDTLLPPPSRFWGTITTTLLIKW